MLNFINKMSIILTLFLSVTAFVFGTQKKPQNQLPNDYIGWWIYGEEEHIFKDETSMGEWVLEFPNENIQELVALYLAVCKMEYFPMETIIKGSLQNDTLFVDDFEILYIEGCGE